MAKYLYAIRIPIIALIASSLLFNYAEGSAFGLIIFNVLRIVIAIWAGWLIVENMRASVAVAAFAGPILLFIDHIIISGIGGVLFHDFSDIRLDDTVTLVFGSPEVTFFMGILVSYLIFFPVSMLFAAFGGYAAKGGKKERMQ